MDSSEEDQVQWVEGQKDKSRIYFLEDGWYYHEKRRNAGYITYNCILRKKDKCPGAARSNLHRGEFEITVDHSHEKAVSYHNALKLEKEIEDRCLADCSLEISRVMDEVLGNSNDIHALSHINRDNLSNSITRKRAQQRPPIPKELLDVEEILSGPDSNKYLRYLKTKDGKDDFFRGVVGPAGHRSIVLSSSRIIDWWSAQLKAGADGNFKLSTKQPLTTQVFVVTGMSNHHTVALAYAIMESKSFEAYRCVIQRLKEVGFRFRQLLTDYEEGQQAAWKAVYPLLDSLKGCYWHFGKAAANKLKELGLLRTLPDEHASIVVGWVFAIPRLPPSRMWEAYRVTLAYAEEKGVNHGGVELFLNYFRDEWLIKFSPQVVSVYQEEYTSTSGMESKNLELNKSITKHPPFWTLFERLQREEQKEFQKAKSLEKRPIISTPQDIAHKTKQLARALERLTVENGAMVDCLKSISEVMRDVKKSACLLILDGESIMEDVIRHEEGEGNDGTDEHLDEPELERDEVLHVENVARQLATANEPELEGEVPHVVNAPRVRPTASARARRNQALNGETSLRLTRRRLSLNSRQGETQAEPSSASSRSRSRSRSPLLRALPQTPSGAPQSAERANSRQAESQAEPSGESSRSRSRSRSPLLRAFPQTPSRAAQNVERANSRQAESQAEPSSSSLRSHTRSRSPLTRASSQNPSNAPPQGVVSNFAVPPPVLYLPPPTGFSAVRSLALKFPVFNPSIPPPAIPFTFDPSIPPPTLRKMSFPVMFNPTVPPPPVRSIVSFNPSVPPPTAAMYSVQRFELAVVPPTVSSTRPMALPNEQPINRPPSNASIIHDSSSEVVDASNNGVRIAATGDNADADPGQSITRPPSETEDGSAEDSDAARTAMSSAHTGDDVHAVPRQPITRPPSEIVDDTAEDSVTGDDNAVRSAMSSARTDVHEDSLRPSPEGSSDDDDDVIFVGVVEDHTAEVNQLRVTQEQGQERQEADHITRTRRLIAEQNREYQASLAADRLTASQQRRQQQAAILEAERVNSVELQKQRIGASVIPSLTENTPSYKFTITLPNGRRLVQNIPQTASVQVLWMFIFQQAETPLQFVVTTTNPRRILSDIHQWNNTPLLESSIDNRYVLRVEEMDESDVMDTCSICLYLRTTTYLTTCNHKYCLSCIEQLSPSVCPLCRIRFNRQSVTSLEHE